MHHLHHDGSPASDLHHLHQPCITCINPASPASTLHHAQKAASTLHQPRTGCITRTRELGKPKHQAPSTQVTRNHPYARCPLPHRNGRRGCPASSARARSARARERGRTRMTHKERAHARTPRAPRGPHRYVTAPRATCVVRPLVGARPHQCAAEQGWKGDSNCQRSAECGEKTIRQEEGKSTPARLRRREPPATHAHITRASALRGRHRRRDPRRRESHGAEWAQREDATRDTRAMTDDEGTRPYFTARCARCKRPPLLAGRLLAPEPAASFVRATPPRRPPARAQRCGQRRRRCGEL